MEFVYLTKYALTQGVQKHRVWLLVEDTYVRISGHSDIYKLGRDCAATHEQAIEIAEDMRQAKLASLRKSVAKYERLKFGGAK